MTKLKNILISASVGAGVMGLVAFFSRPQNKEGEFDSKVAGTLLEPESEGVSMQLDIEYTNPGKKPLQINSVQVQISYKSVRFIDTKRFVRTLSVPPKGRVTAGITLKLPASRFINLNRGLWDSVIGKRPLFLDSILITELNVEGRVKQVVKGQGLTVLPVSMRIKK